MSLVVMKFGGTSVGTIERIKNVAKRVAKKKDEGHDVIVTVSAMAGETDRLINLIKEIDPKYDPREYDMVVSTGEQVSIGLLAQALKSMGYDAVSLTGPQIGMITDGAHSKARIVEITGERLRKELKEGKICVVAGFQGIYPKTGDITTLGRGGSDTTAVAIAAAMKANVCEIYTDVDGVYTADPRIVKKAKKLDKISYEEMLELASLGAKVLQSRSVEFGMKYNVDILVLSSLEEKPGTLVTKEDKDMEKVIVSGVTSDKNQAKITITEVPDRPGIAAEIFEELAKQNINVDMIVQNVSTEGKTDISFTVAQTDILRAYDACKEIAKNIGASNVLSDENIAKVSIVGVGMKSHAGVAAAMFKTLAENNINIQMISTSEIKVSCVIDEKFSELAVRVLHERFVEEGDHVS
ncbi:aspartate kinase, monofunctional class [Deferribacter desulfuricans SSM1]|uniref:Aspartokinase n=1 Tax=Deferribacter desulfuricans (strain DSM 14783 / JCM 11476 / NBRC 101012 / SSM1) TaxID=639282 RepID=D3PDH4_DEFDS|nr:aspartate kinase [Deferribacter desulfuricans]BAI80647.1 aspartate kinase, monofunctional class [Deferribacter desulfuricans SSM1]